MTGGPITFKPVGHEHLTLLADWFARPHVRAWWGPAGEELDAVRADLEGRPGASGFAMWIAALDGAPFAYVQDQPAPASGDPLFRGAPPGACAADFLIGPPTHLGRGLAAPLLRAFAAHAAARGAASLLLDPDAANAASLAACRRAGAAEWRRVREGGRETILFLLAPVPLTPVRPAREAAA